ncbi:MAG: peptidoglycan DD-metalloendopeptidase family protein [Actinobacteria bacterium]|nr:peptidoglycan DD-metalloendopeptidase family protein [Actinomycetota bacterium]
MSMRRLWVVLGLTLALVFAASAAGQDPEAEKAQVDQRLAELQAEISAAKEQEGVLTSQLGAVVSELRAAQSAVEQAEGSLDLLEAELVSEQERLERLTALLGEQTRRLHRLQREYRRAVEILEARVRAIYIEEEPDALSVLVSATTFGDLIDGYEFVSRIGRQDQRIAGQVESAKRRAAEKRRATEHTERLAAATVSVIAARADEARSVRNELASNRDTLAAARRLKRSALATSRDTREEYLQEVEALAAESASLAAAIREAQAQAAAGSSGAGTASASGFIWPVNGAVVSGFGWRWGRMHEGIDISASSGTPIWAAAAGTVIHAGWLGGYGNLVVVDHGDGLATAYAHASAILVGVGQQVSQGETLSLVGSTGNSSGPHLHFEVRVNGAAVDPLFYL